MLDRLDAIGPFLIRIIGFSSLRYPAAFWWGQKIFISIGSPIPAIDQFATFKNSYDIMLYLVGLGLADEKDITVRGLEVVKKAERVYLEAYTAILLVEKEKLVSVFYDRLMVTSQGDHS